MIESGEYKGMLLMVVFKQSQMAQTSHPASKTNERSRVGEDARDREHQHERELISGRQDLPGEDVAYGG